MENEERKYEDAEAFSYSFDKEKLSFKDIVLQHLKKIGTFSSVEFRGGYWEEKPIAIGGLTTSIRVYIPDSRETYSNAIDYLADLLYPHFDEQMLKAFKESEQETKKAFNDNTVVSEPDREDQMPEGDRKPRAWSSGENKASYRSIKRRINRVLFREIACFLHRKKYLEIGAIED